MNVPKAIEMALAGTIRKYAEIGEGVTIRPWQSLAADGSWRSDTDRVFPMIDVRCAPPKTDDNQAALACECAVLLGTKTDADKNHLIISALYGAVQGLCNSMFAQFRNSTADGSLDYFNAAVLAEASCYGFGGLTFGEGLAPADDAGINMIGIALNVHYSRSDY